MTSPIAPDPILQVSDQLMSPVNVQDLTYCSFVQAVVTAINGADNTFSANIGGDATTVVAGIKSLTSFQPTVGDTVICLKQKTDVVGIGKVAVSTAQAYGQAQNYVTANNVITAGNPGFFTLTSSPNSATMTKRFSTSNVFVNLSLTGWGDVTTGVQLRTAVSVGGVDYVVGAVTMVSYSNTLPTAWTSPRGTAVGSIVIPGLAAGSVTALVRISNPTGVGNLHVDTGDFMSLTLQEVL